MKKRFLSFLLATVVLSTSLLGACGNDRETFAEYTDSIFLDEISANTLNLHYTIENPKEYGIKRYNISLGSYSTDSQDAYINTLKKMQLELLTYPYSSLSLEEKLTYDIYNDFLETRLRLSGFPLYEEPLTYSNGMQLQLPILLAEYDFNHAQDIMDYLELLALVDDYLADIIEFEKEKSKAGLFMSDELCERVIDSCEAFLENQENHYLLTTFENRLKDFDLSEKMAEKYLNQNESIFREEIVPAYENLIKELTKLLGTGTNTGGICNLPDGKKYYEILVYSETGCEDSVDDIYDRIEYQRMLDLLVCEDLQDTRPSIYEDCAAIPWTMSDPHEMLALLQQKMLVDFPEAPTTDYTISYVDPALEEYLAPAFYIVAPIDDYLENTIYINDANDSNDVYYFTTLAHEGFPGHLYQTVMSYEYDMMDLRHIFNYSGYSEGWATYIEMMSYYYCDLEEDIATMLSRNQSATLSLYASSDIGLHYYGWTEEDMYGFWASYGITDKDVINEITQLILSEPGNYLKYYVGYLEFLELRDHAKEILGSDFSLREFHRAILDIGPAPFPILEEYLERYYRPTPS